MIDYFVYTCKTELTDRARDETQINENCVVGALTWSNKFTASYS